MSSFVWIDHSEKQRRQVLEAIDQFRERNTRDELGLAAIRDAIADTLFPGTGALQTRARYFFFVPWTIQRHAGRGKGDAVRRIRDEELRLIDVLALSENPSPRGTIGILARKALQRCPSSIYWNGLKVLGFCNIGGSLGDYLRHTDRSDAATKVLQDDDGDLVEGRPAAWVKLPRVPEDFPEGARMALTGEEARFLKNQVISRHPASLFAYLLQENVADSDIPFAWDHQATGHAPRALERRIGHARLFSEVMYGAPIVYNLGLAQMEPVRQEIVAGCVELLAEWRQLLDRRQQALASLSLDDFWIFVHECGCRPSMSTTLFVERWFSIARDDARRSALESDVGARQLVFAREQQIKGQMARSLPGNHRARETWLGEAGLGRMTYRWGTAETYLNDIADGLKGDTRA